MRRGRTEVICFTQGARFVRRAGVGKRIGTNRKRKKKRQKAADE